MTALRKEHIHTLLKGIETGDESSVAVVNPNKYIQHNPQTHEGGIGLAELFRQLAKTSPRVNIVRIFSDGDYVFAHTEYDFSESNIGFEVFRFEGDQTVEHWDNIQLRKGPNSSGNTMVDGSTEITDYDKTEYNRDIINSFVTNVLIEQQFNNLKNYINDNYIEHNPQIGNGPSALQSALSKPNSVLYKKNHRILAEGNFILSVCEGAMNEKHTSFFDLFRIARGKIVEHWDTTEAIPPECEWKNDNGKF